MEKIELVRELLAFAHTLMEAEVDRRVEDQFFVAQPRAGVVSAAGIYAHSLMDEDHAISKLLGSPLLFASGQWAERLGFEPRGDITPDWAAGMKFEVAHLREYATALYARSDSALAALAPDAADRLVRNWEPIREDGQMRFAERQMPFLFSFMDNVVLHTVGHLGEIAVVMNLARRR